MEPLNRRSNRVFVDNKIILDTMMENASVGHAGKKNSLQPSFSSPTSNIASTHQREVSVKLLQEQREIQNLQTDILMKNNIRKSLESSKEKQEKLFPELLSNVSKAQSFLDSVDKDISLHDETKKNKTRRQFEEWNTIVHGGIQVEIIYCVLYMLLLHA